MAAGERALSRSIAAAPDDGLWAYFGAAQAASPWHQALNQAADEAAKLAEGKMDPSSAPAMALANRLVRICSDHSLGDPLVYARWAGAMQFRSSADENARKKSAWAYLASALRRTRKARALLNADDFPEGRAAAPQTKGWRRKPDLKDVVQPVALHLPLGCRWSETSRQHNGFHQTAQKSLPIEACALDAVPNLWQECEQRQGSIWPDRRH
jgi:hypothetical protein